MGQGGSSRRALRVERTGEEDGQGCERQGSGKAVLQHPAPAAPTQRCGVPTVGASAPVLTAMGGFAFSRALLQGLADNSHISDLHLDLSNCEVRGQHPWVPWGQPEAPATAAEGRSAPCPRRSWADLPDAGSRSQGSAPPSLLMSCCFFQAEISGGPSHPRPHP